MNKKTPKTIRDIGEG